MLIFYIIAAAAAWAAAKALNHTAWKGHPAPAWLALILSFALWVPFTILLTAARMHDYAVAGLPTPGLDVIGSSIAAVVFYQTLRLRDKEQSIDPRPHK